MSNSSLVNYTRISPHRTSPRNHKIDTITIHHMAGNLTVERCGEVFQSREASTNYGIGTDGRVGMYVEEKDRSWASANAPNDHRAVTIELANDGGASTNWHVSDTAIEKCIELCVDICQRNGIPRLNFTGDRSGNLTMHKWFYATACPGPYLESKFGYIADEVNRRLEGQKVTNGGEQKAPLLGEYTLEAFIRDVQRVTGSVVDGIPGAETIGNTETLSTESGLDQHILVYLVQKRLTQLGYAVGGTDGIYGEQTKTAVTEYQEDNDCTADGEITKACKTWRKLLGME